MVSQQIRASKKHSCTEECVRCEQADHRGARPSQIIASERNMQKIIRVLQEEYVNPFAIDLESTQLINLSSGVPLPDDLSTNILNIRQIGLTKFRDQRLRSKNVLFHSSVT